MAMQTQLQTAMPLEAAADYGHPSRRRWCRDDGLGALVAPVLRRGGDHQSASSLRALVEWRRSDDHA
jgi:hypothetical protein